MNTDLIISMAQIFVKDGAIAYDEFDKLYSDLSRKEQYEVVNILYDNGINLVDEHIEDETAVFDEEDYLDAFFADNELTEGHSIDSFFTDPGFSEELSSALIISAVVHQSNGILCSLIQQGNRQAAQDICIKNKALVDKYAIAYQKRYGNGLDFEDLEQAGFIGLLKAAQKYNSSLGAFSTYAVFWIKQAIVREIFDFGFVIRIPVHMMERINKVTEADYCCPNEASSAERIEFIADKLNLTKKEVMECQFLRANVLTYTSLATLVGDDEDSELGDLLPSGEDLSPVETEVFERSLQKEIDTVLNTLTPRERRVIIMRFGLHDGKPMTLEQIGNELNVTRERIRQIEAKALRKLKHPSRSKRIKVYCEV